MTPIRLFFAIGLTLAASPGAPRAQQPDCLQLGIAVVDSEQGTPIAGASVLDLGSSRIVETDDEGLATFPDVYPGGARVVLQIVAPSYPQTFREVVLPTPQAGATCSEPSSFIVTLALSADKLYLSPPIGPAGGERTLMHPTGQWLYDDESFTGTPDEYLQRYEIIVPQGALPSQYRIGFTPVLERAFVNAFFDTIAGQEVRPIAQFRITLYDVDGNPVPSPTFDPPIRIEVAAATVEPWTRIEPGMTLGFRHFDPDAMTWDQSGIVNSGIVPGTASAFVEVSHFSEYGLFELEPKAHDRR